MAERILLFQGCILEYDAESLVLRPQFIYSLCAYILNPTTQTDDN